MKVEQIYTGCLAQGAYYVESQGEVAIIDPLREVQDYIDRSTKDSAKIKYIFETHFHADFVSGHVTLAEKTGAKIVFGPNAETKFDSYQAKDGEVFQVFDSLRSKVMTLADDVIVYPAHGAGSACGKNLSKETVGTIGEQKKTNYALRADMTKEEFVQEVTDGLLPPPEYFPLNVKLNKEGYQSIDKVLEKGAKPLSVDNFELIANETDALILDVRHQFEFVKGFIPQSIFIGLSGTFAPWVGALIKDIHQPILLVVEEGQEEQAITRLSRVGFDNVLGYLKGGFTSWKDDGKEVDTLLSVSAETLEQKINEGAIVFDVRKPGEYTAEHIENVPSAPLDFLNDHIAEFPTDSDFYVHCAGGYRSVIAASILKARGFHKVIDVAGGYGAIKKTGIKRTDVITCSSTKS